MKPIEDIHVAIIDAGTFIPLADMMGKVVGKSSYYSPYEQEYLNLHRCVIGDGMQHFSRVDDYMDPDFFNSVDLWIFPDVGFGGFQRYLRSLNKSVWGSMGASDIELYRTRFLKVIKDAGLPVVKSVTIRGVTSLAEHLKTVKDKWVKINRYRDNMETWHHLDYGHSERELERLCMEFGPLKDLPVFVVQDPVDDEGDTPVIEVGYDGWTVDGEFPGISYQGVEKKNQLYLGSQLRYSELPEPVRLVNEAMSPLLDQYGYRNFWATEIRVRGDDFFFIDPTPRMAGQTMEHLLKTCTNLPEVIYKGAAGELIKPEFEEMFAAEATLHYHPPNECETAWKTFRMPKEAEPYVKLYRACYHDGAYHFPPHKSDELGVVIGNGATVEEAIEDLKDNFDLIDGEPVSIELSGFADLLEEIGTAQEHGVPFSDEPIPSPESVLT